MFPLKKKRNFIMVLIKLVSGQVKLVKFGRAEDKNALCTGAAILGVDRLKAAFNFVSLEIFLRGGIRRFYLISLFSAT